MSNTKLLTQNGTAIWKHEREARVAAWTAACAAVEAEVGRPTPANVEAFRAALDLLEAALPVLSSEADVPWPSSPEQFRDLVEQTGAMVIVFEVLEDGTVAGVCHVA